ncbi:MAG TPA: carboxypeptidase-like regulatory domain-containing protein [Bryobacteraceae bacterium]|jgi:hypothetical protein|nr:carboxypeptidase-like regulatory domain-containing protein [Bryobacteraceae bacterium]
MAAQDPPRGSVEGTVVNTFTGTGIGGVTVTLIGGQSGRHTAMSDGAVRFRIADVAPGTYTPIAEKDGFSATIPITREFANRGLRVDAAGEPAKVELKLTPLQTVLGRVLTPDGKPAAGAKVELNPSIYGSVTTDAEGRFRFESVRPDSYTLMARPPKDSNDAKPEQSADGTRLPWLRPGIRP